MNSQTSIQLRLKNLLSTGIAYAVPQWRWYLAGIVALICTNIVMLEIPQLAKQVINAISAQQPLQEFTWLTVGIICLGFLLIAIRTASRVFIFWPGRTLEAAVKDDLFEHILRVPTGLIAKFGLGDLTSRLSNDVTQLRVFFAFGVLQVLNVVFMSSFTIVKMASLNGILTALTVAPLLLMLVLTRLVMPKLYKATKDSTEATGRLTNRVTEAFLNVNTIQSSGSVDAFVHRSVLESQLIYDANMRTVRIRNLIFPLMSIMAGISEFAILAWGGHEVIVGNLSVGDLMAFSIYVGILLFPFTSIGLILAIYQRAKPAAERLGEVASYPAEATESGTHHLKSNDHPQIELKHLSFSYVADREVLTNLDLKITRGQRIGIYGAIGSGKSTLFNLLTRLYEAPRGSIFLDGIDILDIAPAVIRSKISYAQQTPLLFSESIRENLLLGFEEHEVSETQLEDAARRAQILGEIERFPEKWQTIVGESGVRLSGGQKQRLALARLLLRPAEIFILDDVLSAVDHITEQHMIDALLATKATLIIASHRTSILESCDEVWVMEKGVLLGKGRFKDVLHLIARVTPTETTPSPEVLI